MAKRKSSELKIGKNYPSWQNRRWKIFENQYQTNGKFQAEINAFKSQDVLEYGPELYELLPKYGVSRACAMAAVKYIENPKLERKEYLAEISPPFKYWSALSDFVYGNINKNPKTYFRLPQFKATLSGRGVSFKDLANLIAGDEIVLQLSPYLNKTEVHELIDENWEGIQKLLNMQNPTNNSNHGPKLLQVVQPNRKTERTLHRNAKILELHKKGKSDLEIFNKLMADYEKYKPIPSVEYIRVIRHRSKDITD